MIVDDGDNAVEGLGRRVSRSRGQGLLRNGLRGSGLRFNRHWGLGASIDGA